MEIRLLAKTGLQIPAFCLGTASLHHVWSTGARQRLLESAVDIGMTHVDTAPYYGDGIAEAAIGRLPEHVRRRVTVSTKFGLYPRLGRTASTAKVLMRRARSLIHRRSPAPVVSFDTRRAAVSLEDSLRSLRRETVDLLFLHEPTAGAIDGHQLLHWLEACRQSGKLRAWGIAGERNDVSEVLERQPELAPVLQTRMRRDADRESPRLQPDILYGCLRDLEPHATNVAVATRLRSVSETNPRTSVLMSTTRIEHLRAVELATS
jgi:aryl-alcohol dehydrogenase-like predicted oxidoreductase